MSPKSQNVKHNNIQLLMHFFGSTTDYIDTNMSILTNTYLHVRQQVYQRAQLVCAVSDQKTRLIFQRNIINFLHFIFTASLISVYSCFKSCFVRICAILMFSFISLYWCSLFYMPVFRPFYSSIWRSCERAELVRCVRATPGGRMRISTRAGKGEHRQLWSSGIW